MTSVVALDSQGRLLLQGGRFSLRRDAEAHAQCLTEHLCLKTGEDRRRPYRGMPWDQIFQAKTSPRAVSNAAAREANRDPVVKVATADPIGSGYVPSSSTAPGDPARIYAIEVRAVGNDGTTIIALIQKGAAETSGTT